MQLHGDEQPSPRAHTRAWQAGDSTRCAETFRLLALYAGQGKPLLVFDSTQVRQAALRASLDILCWVHAQPCTPIRRVALSTSVAVGAPSRADAVPCAQNRPATMLSRDANVADSNAS